MSDFLTRAAGHGAAMLRSGTLASCSATFLIHLPVPHAVHCSHGMSRVLFACQPRGDPGGGDRSSGGRVPGGDGSRDGSHACGDKKR